MKWINTKKHSKKAGVWSRMNIVVAMDSFKGSMSSKTAGQAAAEGIRRVYPEAEIFVRPLADGGEGTVEALIQGVGGRRETVRVTGPLGEPVDCHYGILPGQTIMEQKTAVIEMAGAAGLPLLAPEKRNPLLTTTYGVGEVIKDAVEKGCRRFIVGIGGSATNDGGVGMLQALGFSFLDREGRQAGFGARALMDIHRISAEKVMPELSECVFRVACDVTNPLCGERGASAVYGPQKGAGPDMVEQMDKGLAHLAEVSKDFTGADPDYPGTGAAGGLGFGFLTFLNSTLESGVKIVLEETGLEEYIRKADFVVTGEGRLDGQTVQGKAPMGVAELAKAWDKRVFAFSGCVTSKASLCNEAGIDAFFPILRSPASLEEVMKEENAVKNMADTAEQVFRAVKALQK